MSKIKWELDPSHSEVEFKVKHMMITNVTGLFTDFNLSLTTEDENFDNADATFTIDVKSVNTKNEQRDEHLRSADFFDAANYPEIVFKSTALSRDGDEGKLTGDLTIKGVTKSITLDIEFGGAQKDPWGNIKTGFSISGKIKRTDFGLTWNAALETGGVMVSDDVKVNIEIQITKAQ